MIKTTKDMRLRYIKGDLFTARTSLAHCVSADFHMSAGIAKEFKLRFGRQESLIRSECPVGLTVGFDSGTILQDESGLNKSQIIYCLVTKKRFFDKPRLKDIRTALISMRNMMEYYHANEVSMPKIASGLDQVPWERVEKCILNVFQDTSININIYTLH